MFFFFHKFLKIWNSTSFLHFLSLFRFWYDLFVIPNGSKHSTPGPCIDSNRAASRCKHAQVTGGYSRKKRKGRSGCSPFWFVCIFVAFSMSVYLLNILFFFSQLKADASMGEQFSVYIDWFPHSRFIRHHSPPREMCTTLPQRGDTAERIAVLLPHKPLALCQLKIKLWQRCCALPLRGEYSCLVVVNHCIAVWREAVCSGSCRDRSKKHQRCLFYVASETCASLFSVENIARQH